MKKVILILVGIILFSFSGIASNLGEECEKSSDCSIGSCLFCPTDTIFEIYTNKDVMGAEACKFIKEKYGEKASCQEGDEFNIATRESSKSYCGRIHAKYGTKCLGNWNGDNYYIKFFGENVIDEERSLNKFLTQDILNIWKEEVLKMISEDYFNKNFDIDFIEGEVYKEDGKNDRFNARINYNFKLDWVETEKTGQGTWDMLTIAEKIDGKWMKLTKEEIATSYRAELERWHKLGLIRLTEYKISSIISEDEANKVLKNCNKNLKIQRVFVESKEGNIILKGVGEAKIGTEKCENNPKNVFTYAIGTVNLQTGETMECKVEEIPCSAGYAKSSELGIELKVSQVFQSKEGDKFGFFQKIINWFKGLLS